MTIDPAELVIDMPVDEKHVQELMASIQDIGVCQPIYVHLNSMRIIDGFHRTEAARRAGINKIPAIIQDCDEETFWSLRIISARTHAAVENSRIAAWMVECWKQTKWHVELRPNEEGLLPRAYSNTSVDLRLVEMVWQIFFIKFSSSIFPNLEKLTDDEKELREWIVQRSQQWGIDISQFAVMFLSAMGIYQNFLAGHGNYGQYDQWARDYNLNLKQRLRLQKEIMTMPGRNSQPSEKIAEEFIEEKIAKDIDDGESYYAFASKRLEEKREAYRAAQEEEQRKRREKEADPVYQRIQANNEKRAATKAVSDTLNEFRNWARSIESSLLSVDDGQSLFDSFVADMIATRNRLWPNANAIQGTNSLQMKITELERENSSLRRALDAKTRVSTSVVEMPSSEVRRLPA
jgi:hypothetical protein